MLWAGWVLGGLVYLVWTEVFVRYARRNGHDRPRLHRTAAWPSLFIAAGCGLLPVNPVDGLVLLAAPADA